MSACQQSVEPTPPNIESHGWNYYAKGNYNWVYLNKAKTRVFKIQIIQGDYVDTPERSVRLWNEINSHIGQAKIVNIGNNIGWEAPFVVGQQALDEDISAFVLDLYQQSGRILVDAPSGGNVLKTHDNQLVCIDIGMAVRLEQQQQRMISDDKVWRKSFDSIRVWRESKQLYSNYFANDLLRTRSAKTVSMIKSLLLLQAVIPGLIELEFLQHNAELLQRLAKIYDCDYDYDDDSPTVIGNEAITTKIYNLFNQYKDNLRVMASTSSTLAVPLPALQTKTKGKKAHTQFKATTKAMKSEKLSSWSSHFFSSKSPKEMALYVSGGCITAAIAVCGLLTASDMTTFGVAPAILLSIFAVSLVTVSLFSGVGISMMHSQQNQFFLSKI